MENQTYSITGPPHAFHHAEYKFFYPKRITHYLLIIIKQVSSLKADQLELTRACLSSLVVMYPLWSASTVWNQEKASGSTPGGMWPVWERTRYKEHIQRTAGPSTRACQEPHQHWEETSSKLLTTGEGKMRLESSPHLLTQPFSPPHKKAGGIC